MKFICSFLFLFLSISNSFAQINVGNGRGIGNLWVAEHKGEIFDHIKKNQTIFILPNFDNRDELKSILASIWTVNEITFVSQEEFNSKKVAYISSGNLLIGFAGFNVSVTRGIREVNNYDKTVFIANIYRNVRENKKGELDYDHTDIAEIYLTPGMIYKNSEDDSHPKIKLGLVKNYFQELNRRLANSENLKMLDGIKKKEKLALLSEKTLIAPWEGLANSPLVSRNRNLIKSWNKAPDVFKNYKYDYEIIPHKDLQDKILEGEDFYYLQFTQYGQHNILSIIHSLTGEIIYLDVKKPSYVVKASRIKDISNSISKSI